MIQRYKYRSKVDEKLINTNKSAPGIKPDEVGTFEVATNYPDQLKKGIGTVLIFFQGIQIKHGREDSIGNSPMSWLEETLFASSEELPEKAAKLPIEHTACKLGFNHFITFSFPDNLTAEGFSVSMKNLLNYLDRNNFTAVIVSFSNGATLVAEWLLNLLLQQSFEVLSLFVKNVLQTVCAGCLFEPKDLELKAYLTGKYFAKPLSRPLSNIPFVEKQFFIRRAGGPADLINRVRYLYSLKNFDHNRNIEKTSWTKAREILKIFPEFQLIFLADQGQRIVLPSGSIKWYQLLHRHFPKNVQGYIAKNVKTGWINYPSAVHHEIKHLWTLISILGTSIKLRNELNYNPMALQIADEWPKRRFTLMNDKNQT